MKIIILGAGLMVHAIIFDLINCSNIEKKIVINNNKPNLNLIKYFF